MKKALTVAGSDPSGGAGLQADLKVFHAFGVYGISAVSALTAQNTVGVKGIMPVPVGFFTRQLTVLLTDIVPEATKTGMLHSESNVRALARMIKKHSLRNIVIDPVITSSSGRRLVERNTMSAIKEELFPHCTLITPNLHEASILTGMAIRTSEDMQKAAVRLKEFGPLNVIITGGHLEGAALDVLYDGEFHYLRGRKVRGEYHGTGCSFSAACTALLARGYSVPDAAAEAKEFMIRSFRTAFSPGKGMRIFNI